VTAAKKYRIYEDCPLDCRDYNCVCNNGKIATYAPIRYDATFVKALLADYLALVERQYYAGDFGAVDRLIDLHSAIEAAGLTARQRQALDLTYYYGYNQREAGGKLGITKQTYEETLSTAIRKIAVVYTEWDAMEADNGEF
jgi:DNA-directed RNA polymerase specialized sigma24 family protein